MSVSSLNNLIAGHVTRGYIGHIRICWNMEYNILNNVASMSSGTI